VGITTLAIGVVVFCAASRSEAQKKYLIGSLNTTEQFINSFEGFRSRMAELGYHEGINSRFEYYSSRGNDQLLKNLAQKLVQDQLDLIVTSSTTATVAAAKATEGSHTPVLFLSAGNPQKLVKSFSSSGSNLTGISSGSLELTGKRMELLRELAPRARKVVMPIDPGGVNYQANTQEVKEAATRFGFTVVELTATTPEDLVKRANEISRKSFDAIFIPADSLISNGIAALARVAVAERLPLVASLLALVKLGALGSYAADYAALGRQGALLADKLLRGARPSELPIELPRKYMLALNLAAARAIDLKIGKDLLLLADQVFE